MQRDLMTIKGLKKKPKMSEFQFGNCDNPRGGLDFSKMSELG